MAEHPQDIVTRFAPSPTGRLHLGHALSAVLSHDFARAHRGRFVLRIEDIDTARCRTEFTDAILDDLRWLGIDWDRLDIQTDRAADHAAALDRLQAMGLLYPCTCTRAEIAASASAPHGGAGPIYPGTCRGRTDAPEGAAWRLDMAKASAIVGVSGRHDDVVLARKGLGVAYHLAVVVDDAAAGVTDVIRGADLLSATPVQNLLQVLLGLPVPRYTHHPLVAGSDGKRLAKRTPGATLADLRAAGADPALLRNDLRSGRLPVGFGWADA
ncbi:tRNA glutamyl-Q(34) synthetase GluQRS [Sphingomonas sp. SUN039]|uniref:tRNA glutamyl-Q(34) synthetase GluQRS n=1 Tax=Sphingomonas sp. SUN039 TaxID=2937787 RepID=UPI00216450D6|nr:tRNA glutamyl-Q(34) synthetase GluQRS [Sphingomonas sp. SUN039]UVO55116.1 tRNA glutamyl-Q(34) synthetase GluQRS [Sphingomonas sp. SUN039]